MPRVRELNPQNKKKAILQFCLAWKNWDDLRLERELGISHSTRSARFKDISKFSYDDICKIVRGVPLTVTQVEILFDITWDTSNLEMKLKGLM